MICDIFPNASVSSAILCQAFLVNDHCILQSDGTCSSCVVARWNRHTSGTEGLTEEIDRLADVWITQTDSQTDRQTAKHAEHLEYSRSN